MRVPVQDRHEHLGRAGREQHVADAAAEVPRAWKSSQTRSALVSALFPAEIRTTGMSLAYNLAVTLLGGVAPRRGDRPARQPRVLLHSRRGALDPSHRGSPQGLRAAVKPSARRWRSRTDPNPQPLPALLSRGCGVPVTRWKTSPSTSATAAEGRRSRRSTGTLECSSPFRAGAGSGRPRPGVPSKEPLLGHISAGADWVWRVQRQRRLLCSDPSAQ